MKNRLILLVFFTLISVTPKVGNALEFNKLAKITAYSNNVNPEDVYYLALNIYHEARGEKSKMGKIAVGLVVMNRVQSKRFPNSIKEVVQQGGEVRNKCQFAWLCDGRPDTPRDWKSWQESNFIALQILNGRYKDYTMGAVFYYNHITVPYLCWGNASSFTKVIGNHKFFGDIPWPEMKRLCRPS